MKSLVRGHMGQKGYYDRQAVRERMEDSGKCPTPNDTAPGTSSPPARPHVLMFPNLPKTVLAKFDTWSCVFNLSILNLYSKCALQCKTYDLQKVEFSFRLQGTLFLYEILSVPYASRALVPLTGNLLMCAMNNLTQLVNSNGKGVIVFYFIKCKS